MLEKFKSVHILFLEIAVAYFSQEYIVNILVQIIIETKEEKIVWQRKSHKFKNPQF